MKLKESKVIYSPTDLTKFIESPFSSWMDHKAMIFPELNEKKTKPESFAEFLFKKGNKFEEEYLKKLQTEHDVFDASLKNKKESLDDSVEDRTLYAMKKGVSVVYQAKLKKDDFEGFADFLVKVDGESKLGNYHYTIKDTKLSKVPKAKFILQLCAYAEMLYDYQGRYPEHISIILGDEEEKVYKLDDYFFYYQKVKEMFLDFHNNFNLKEMPIPEKNENFGDWREYALNILEESNDISLIANISKSQVKNLKNANLKTITDVIDAKFEDIKGIQSEKFEKIQKQAFIQKESFSKKKPLFDVLNHYENNPKGLLNLPPKSENDVYLHVEHSSIAHEKGLTFYFTFVQRINGRFKHTKIFIKEKEKEVEGLDKFLSKLKAIFGSFEDDDVEIDHNAHIYIYGIQSLNVLKNMCSKSNVGKDILNYLIAFHKIIDLSLLLRQSIVIGTSSYDLFDVIKILPKKYRIKSDPEALINLFNEYENIDDKKIKKEVEKEINKTILNIVKTIFTLHEWMLKIQTDYNIRYIPYEEREEKKARDLKKITNKEDSEEDIILLPDEIPFDDESYFSLSQKEKIKILMNQLIYFHDNEDKPAFQSIMEKFKLLEEDWEEDLECLAFLRKVSQDPKAPHIILYKYDPKQDTKIKEGSSVKVFHNKVIQGKVLMLDLEKGLIRIQFTKKYTHLIEERNTISVIAYSYINKKVLKDSIQEAFLNMDNNDNSLGLNPCLYDFLMRNPPNVNGQKRGIDLYKEDDDLIESIQNVTKNLNNSTLIIQGPPGAGKTFTSGNVILELLKAGKKIAITSNSHKAINNLMLKVEELSPQKHKFMKVTRHEEEDLINGIANIDFLPTASKFKEEHFNAEIIGGTAFTFANSNFKGYFDYLFIDEAGQMSLANLVSMSRCTKNIILIGDQMQLEQPIQAEHPGESGLSTLEYFLEDYKTIPKSLGYFLPITRRMNQELCSFVSKCFYDKRLFSHESTHINQLFLNNKDCIEKEKGIQFVPVEHEGNIQYSPEEIVEIDKIVQELLKQDIQLNENGKLIKRQVKLSDIIFVSPYNLQVLKLKEKLGEEARVGSVDLFQGQEAPIVIMSLCSSEGTSGRGIEFLLSENRMNVALSRGKALAIVVGNPHLCSIKTSSIDTIRLLNMYCQLIEE